MKSYYFLKLWLVKTYYKLLDRLLDAGKACYNYYIKTSFNVQLKSNMSFVVEQN